MKHKIIVGNIGTVLETDDKNEAQTAYDIYTNMSVSGYGRCANETVTWMIDREIYQETEV